MNRFFLTVLLGYLVGILFAPKKGKDLREDIRERLQDLQNMGTDVAELLLQKGRNWLGASASLRNRKPEANAPARLDPLWIAKLLSEGRDVDIDCLRSAVPMRVPDFSEDLASGDHRPWIEREQGKQVEFLWSKGQFFAGQQHPVGAPVDLELADELRTGHGQWRCAPTAHSSYAGDELTETERLDNIIVCSELKSDHPVRLVVACGDDDYRDRGASPQLPADLEASCVWKPEVEQDEIGRRR